MIGPDAPSRSDSPQAETAGDGRQASPSSEQGWTEAPGGQTFGSSSEPFTQAASPSPSEPPPAASGPSGETTPPPQPETSTAKVAPTTATPVPVRKALRPAPPGTGTPWLPPGLGALLPRLALAILLLAIPVAAAFALQFWLARTHVAYDGNLLLADGGADEVTALYWSPTDGALYVGTRSGGLKSIGRDGLLTDMWDLGAAGNAALPPMTNPVQSFLPWTRQANEGPVVVFQDRGNTVSAGFAQGYTITPSGGGISRFDGGLLATVDVNNGTAVVGRAVTADGGQQFQLPTASGREFQNPNVVAPQQEQVQSQPTGAQLKGEPIQEPAPIAPTPSSAARYNLVLFRDFQSASATEVGEIFGIEDVRAVAALPGTSTVIAGDGEGNVFAIDASQQISGASPETYIRGIGQHEAAIAEIAVATEPGNGSVLFATRAEDRSIKVWRGAVTRAAQLLPLGDYPSADVTTSGSTWVREPVSFASRRSRATDVTPTALLGMSADGRRILARRANTELVLLDLPAPGEEGTATEDRDVYYVAADSPAALSPDGSRLLAPDITNNTIGMIDLSDVPSGQASQYAVASFSGLAGIQFRRFAFDGTGQRFIAIATNGTVYIQNVATPEQAVTLGQYQGTGVDAAISPDGSLVAVAEASGQIMVHSAEDGSELTILNGPQNLARLSFDASGKRLRAVGDDAGNTGGATIFTYSLRNSRTTTYLAGFTADVAREGFLANGDRYLLRNGDAGYRIVDLDSNADAGVLEAAVNATGWVSNLDGSRIATLGGRGNISVFHEQESPTANGPMPAMADNAMRLSADGRTLIAGSRNGDLYLARLEGDAGQTGHRLRRLALPAPALQYEIAPDGASIVTAEADGTVAISDLTFPQAAADASAGDVQTAGAEPTPAATVAETMELPGHGAPVTAIALSPDGEELATASLDGRLRVTSIAWAKWVHAIPLAELPSGPERERIEPQPLDESPYALMSGFGGSSDFGDSQSADDTFIVVYNARKSLGQALSERERAAAAGFPDGLIYRRQGFFRGVFAFPTDEARNAALPGIQQAFTGAYARDLRSWCPNSTRNPLVSYVDCPAVVAGTEPPTTGAEPQPAMAN